MTNIRRSLFNSLVFVMTSSVVSSKVFADDETKTYEGYQAYAYYEGIGPDDERSGQRSDGTTHGMPCILKDDISKAEEKTYNFWHGHNREIHQFTISAELFEQLKQGKPIQIYTEIVDGHRHALIVDVTKTCTPKAE